MTRLRKGDLAPDFTLESINMGIVTLSKYRGSRTLLVFSRYFGCPVCQYEFDELLEYIDKRSELKMVYINQSKPESARSYIKGLDVAFPVITAPRVDGRYPIYDLYNVGRLDLKAIFKIFLKARRAQGKGKRHGPYEGKEDQSPAQFLLDEKGRILEVRYGLFEPVAFI